MTAKLISTHNVGYSAEGKTILSNISFELKKGERLGISGESGCGKTTLAKIIAGILIPDKGTVLRNSKILMLFQNNGELVHPFRKAGDLIAEAVKLSGIKNKDLIATEVETIAQLIRISPDILKRKGCQLSGGEQQRVGLARLLALKPEVLIVDEPFSSQDPDSTENLINILNNAVDRTGLTLVCISHDLKSLVRVSDEIMILKKGELIEKNDTYSIINSPESIFTKFLIRASEYDLKAENFETLNM